VTDTDFRLKAELRTFYAPPRSVARFVGVVYGVGTIFPLLLRRQGAGP